MIKVEVLAGVELGTDGASLEEIDRYISNPDSLVWIDITDPEPDDFELLEREFGFHPLAIDDVKTRHERPKLEQYDSFLFIVFYVVRISDNNTMFSTQEIALFVGPNYLVTVHRGVCAEIEQTAQRWQDNTRKLQSRHVAILLYSLLDTIVDHYFPILDIVAERVNAIEEAIFERQEQSALQEIFVLRKGLIAFRRLLAPERDLMSVLTRRDIELLGPDTGIYFQDIFDHLLRVTDSVDTFRDLLGSALDAYLSVVSNSLNQVMRALTAWSIILMSLAFLAGVYGMNFVNMPELNWEWGYFLALSLMALLGSSLFMLFRRIKWL